MASVLAMNTILNRCLNSFKIRKVIKKFSRYRKWLEILNHFMVVKIREDLFNHLFSKEMLIVFVRHLLNGQTRCRAIFIIFGVYWKYMEGYYLCFMYEVIFAPDMNKTKICNLSNFGVFSLLFFHNRIYQNLHIFRCLIQMCRNAKATWMSAF